MFTLVSFMVSRSRVSFEREYNVEAILTTEEIEKLKECINKKEQDLSDEEFEFREACLNKIEEEAPYKDTIIDIEQDDCNEYDYEWCE